MRMIYLLLSTLIFILFTGCSTSSKIASLKPEPSTNTPMAYQMTTSTINMPMEITLKEIENQLNKNLSG